MLQALSNRAQLRSACVRSILLTLLVAFSLGVTPTARAAVVVDDSIAAMATLTGPAYAVNATHGVVEGDTLYLSFATLDVNTGETLTITGPANVERVVIRVTGGLAAQFDGAVTLSIADASLIVASPLGMSIGEGGVFTVPGDLVLTTADYVRASSGDRFQAPPIASEELPDTAPAHLGFLAGTHGSLVIADATIELTGNLRVVAGSVTIMDTSLTANHVALIGVTLGEVALATLDLTSMTGAGTIELTEVDIDSEEDELVHPAGCGNGWRDPGEACDDGPNMSSTTPDACRPGCEAAGCGDDVIDTGEQCDDGDDNSDDMADSCRTSCDAARCGDDVIDAGEECDDGSRNSDTEAGACRTNCSLCGNGMRGPGEDCDDGPLNSDTEVGGCRTNCTRCGNGEIVAGEECDDGEDNSDTAVDACRTDCFEASCGDEVIDTGEECDDGADNSAGAADACRDTCVLPSCGDRVVDTGEFCDDGPFNSDETPERCRLDCQSENGPLELIGGACEVPRNPTGEWPLGAFVLAAVAILVPLRRRGS